MKEEKSNFFSRLQEQLEKIEFIKNLQLKVVKQLNGLRACTQGRLGIWLK